MKTIEAAVSIQENTVIASGPKTDGAQAVNNFLIVLI